MEILLLIGLAIIIAVIHRNNKQKMIEEDRRKFLLDKYKDEELVNKLIEKTIWVGETKEQLEDSLGKPVDIDEKVLKTKRKETWKYGQTGSNRYILKVVIENDVVLGWDKK